jgi:capsular polysaccharide biosynthesis protein
MERITSIIDVPSIQKEAEAAKKFLNEIETQKRRLADFDSKISMSAKMWMRHIIIAFLVGLVVGIIVSLPK